MWCEVVFEEFEEMVLVVVGCVEDEVCEFGIYVLCDGCNDFVGIGFYDLVFGDCFDWKGICCFFYFDWIGDVVFLFGV